MYAGGSTGLAILRRDAFASMDAGTETGSLTTHSLTFKGKHLFVNVNAKAGQLRLDILSNNGQVIEPFSRENCLAIRSDSTIQAVTWKVGNDVSSLAGRPVKFRFYSNNGQLYSFWVSPDPSGASYGYVAAGGPGLTGVIDAPAVHGLE